MVGQLDDFQRLNVHPIPDLATFQKISGSDIQQCPKRKQVNAYVSQVRINATRFK